MQNFTKHKSCVYNYKQRKRMNPNSIDKLMQAADSIINFFLGDPVGLGLGDPVGLGIKEYPICVQFTG